MLVNSKFEIPIRYLMIILGAFVYALAINLFIEPTGIFSGGTTGISQIINYTFFNGDAQLGLILFCVNLPFMVLGVWKLKSDVIIKTIIFITASSIFIGLLPVVKVVDDQILSVIFGGLFLGLGLGISLRNGGATGGIDIVSLVILEKNPNTTVGRINLLVNICIFVFLGLLINIEVAMLSVLNSYFSTFAVDKLNTYTTKLSVDIKTKHRDAVIEMITNDMHRGSSCWPIEGGYSGEQFYAINTVISQHQLHQFNQKIKQIDPKAFIVMNHVAQIKGNFNPSKY